MLHITMLHIFLGEFLGTMALILLGNGVVANVNFKKTIGSKGGWIVVTFGWAFAVFVGVSIANIWGTGGHINPAVTIGKWVGGQITSVQAGVFIGSQFAGALVGQVVINIFYWQHIKEEAPATVLGMHSTGPTHQKAWFTNFFSEYVGTIILVAMAYFGIAGGWFSSAPLAIGFTVFAIGLSLGGTTGYAINPFRDLAPRIVHKIMYKSVPVLKVANGSLVSSNWKYAIVPVVAPIMAGITVGLFFL